MHIEFTEEAKEKFRIILNESGTSMLRLAYDTEGCGCGVNGVPMIYVEDESKTSDVPVENDFVPVVVDSEQRLFLYESMKVEVVKGAFRFKGSGGILNPVISSRQVCERRELS
ncbi:iron-sulfur cluster biosynthesis family protein [Salimicrobium sp. PL1-032A]|uniref:iron-sulfur cluster biosynthesis family protein n=1 Tax=Salimicrobium sp. PL1-032A TaxID=3095364 RepID=UPI003261C49A